MNIQTKDNFLGQKVVELGAAHHYHFEIVGHGPIPEGLTENMFWTLTPVKYPLGWKLNLRGDQSPLC